MPDVRPSRARVALKLLNRIRARGPREVVLLGLWRAREAWSSEETLILLTRRTSPAPGERDGLRLREAGEEDADRYARDIGTDSPRTFRARLSKRTRCFVITEGDKFVHASWTTTAAAWTRELRRYLKPPGDDAYIYESFTRAETRGRGVFAFALNAIVGRLHDEGIARAWIGVEAHNLFARRSMEKVGFEEAFALGYKRRLGMLTLSEAVGPQAFLAKELIARRWADGQG